MLLNKNIATERAIDSMKTAGNECGLPKCSAVNNPDVKVIATIAPNLNSNVCIIPLNNSSSQIAGSRQTVTNITNIVLCWDSWVTGGESVKSSMRIVKIFTIGINPANKPR